MPLYEYRCPSCEKTFEFLCLSSKDEEEIRCPFCGAKEVQRLLSAFSSRSSDKGGYTASACSSSGGFT